MPGFENTLNVHPLMVHFPIAITLVALLFEGLALILRREQWRMMATVMIYLGALAALVTLATGYLAAESVGHDTPGHEFVHTHRDIMVAFTIIIVGLALANAFMARTGRVDRSPLWGRWVRPVLVLVAAAVLVVGTDRGGELVFRYGIGVRYDPLSAEYHDSHDHDAPVDSSETVPPGETSKDDHEHEPGHQH